MKSLVTASALLLVCYIGPSFAEDTVQEENVIAGIDPATEVRLGILLRDENLKGLERSTNQEYIKTVERIGRRIVNAIYERPDLADDWEFLVIKSPKINAFASGGGKVVVFEGIIDYLTVNGVIDEDMLAAVIGHEMAHNVRRHPLLGESTSGSLAWILDHIDKIKAGGLTEDEIKNLLVLSKARFTRIQEFEADLLGALYATRAGFDGFGGASRWLTKAAHDKDLAYEMTEYFPHANQQGKLVAADHPTYDERLAKLLSYKENISNLAGEFNWGYYLLHTYDFEKAVECFKDVTRVFPNSFEAWNNLGVAYHWQYLQTNGDTEKFQPGLVDYFVQLRDKVRGESPLYKAIRAYRRAVEINPHASGTQSNLAIALVETHEPENLDSAETILRTLLKSDPDNPTYLNDLAILTYWRTQGKPDHDSKQAEAESLFTKAAAAGYLPARYNLAVLRLEIGKEADGLAGLEAYLKEESFSPWAKIALNLLKQHNKAVDPPSSALPDADAAPLGIQLGFNTEEVTKAAGQPDRIEKIETSTGAEGVIFHYNNTLGLSVAFSGGKVILVTLFEPLPANQATAFQPVIGGVAIGTAVDRLKEKLGQPIAVHVDPTSGEKVYSYLAANVIVNFTVSQLRKVTNITVTKRA